MQSLTAITLWSTAYEKTEVEMFASSNTNACCQQIKFNSCYYFHRCDLPITFPFHQSIINTKTDKQDPYKIQRSCSNGKKTESYRDSKQHGIHWLAEGQWLRVLAIQFLKSWHKCLTQFIRFKNWNRNNRNKNQSSYKHKTGHALP